MELEVINPLAGDDPQIVMNIDGATISVAGEVDAYSAPQVLTTIRLLHKLDVGPLICNLSAVTFFSAAGIGMLIKARNELARDADTMQITDSSAPVVRLFVLVNMPTWLAAA